MSDNEYTPTTDDIVRGFTAPLFEIDPVYKGDPIREGESFAAYLSRSSMEAHELQMASEAAARRWLVEHDREVAAKAWGEGLQVAYNHVGRLEDADAAGQGVTIPDPVNPYRAALGVPVGTEQEAENG